MTNPADLIEQIASSIGVQAQIATGDQLADDRELQGIREWLDSDTCGLSNLLAALVHPELVEGYEPEPFSDDWCDQRITRRDAIMAAFKEEPLTKEQADELINELAEIEASLQTCSE